MAGRTPRPKKTVEIKKKPTSIADLTADGDKVLRQIAKLRAPEKDRIFYDLMKERSFEVLNGLKTTNKGRPDSFKPAVRQRLLFAVRKGMSTRWACQYAGINPVTFQYHRQKARNIEDTLSRIVLKEERCRELKIPLLATWEQALVRVELQKQGIRLKESELEALLLTEDEIKFQQGLTQADQKLLEFFMEYDLTIAVGQMDDLEAIDSASRGGDWGASVFRLRNRFPEEWDKDNKSKENLNISVNVGYSYVEVNKVDPVDGEVVEPDAIEAGGGE